MAAAASATRAATGSGAELWQGEQNGASRGMGKLCVRAPHKSTDARASCLRARASLAARERPTAREPSRTKLAMRSVSRLRSARVDPTREQRGRACLPAHAPAAKMRGKLRS
mmetsp:Transcript_11653/g.31391  ORF Transcript_11653/g.31391 Transcript_11653/m.31391 type:complete len:112 (+) Transcript_11653:78-413(+)